jgi:hypothetical protein
MNPDTSNGISRFRSYKKTNLSQYHPIVFAKSWRMAHLNGTHMLCITTSIRSAMFSATKPPEQHNPTNLRATNLNVETRPPPPNFRSENLVPLHRVESSAPQHEPF